MTTDTKAAAPRPSVVSGLTPQERKRLAEEARRLAMKAADGTAAFGPLYQPHCGHPACAIGQVAEAGGVDWHEVHDHPGVAGAYPSLADCFAHAYSAKPSPQVYEFPLLALADALDDATEGSP